MSTKVVELDGTDLSMVITVVARQDASSVAAAICELVARTAASPASEGWRIMSRSEAIVAAPHAWEDSPPWAADGADDPERIAWLREHFSARVTAGFDHLAS